MKNIAMIFKKNILTENPLFVRLLGLSAALVVTESIFSAIAMGVAVAAVLFLSDVTLAALGKIIPKQTRAVAYILVVCGFVTAAELILGAYFPTEREAVGIFLPLIALSEMVIASVKKTHDGDLLMAALDGISTGVGYLAALVLLALIRDAVMCLFDGAEAFPALSFIIIGAAAAGASKLMTLADKKLKPEGKNADCSEGEPVSDSTDIGEEIK